MKHFVCTGGCGGTSDQEGAVCQMESCSLYKQPMKECNCEDGKHVEALEKTAESSQAE